MDEERANATLKKLEKGPLDRFKNQNLLLKKFGQDGLRVYSAISTGKTVSEVLAETGVSEEKSDAILDFMEQNGIVSITSAEEAPSAPPVSEKRSSGQKPSQRRPAPSEPIIVPEENEPEIKPEPEAEPERESAESEEITPIKPILPKGKAPKIEPSESEGLEPIQPISPRQGKASSRRPPPPPVEPEPEPEKEEEAQEPAPEPEPEKEEEAQEPAPEPEPEEEAPIKPTERMREPSPSGPTPPSNLSPLEKIIFGKYGDTGVRVYNLIDGEKTAEEILNETGISEVQLVEMLEFMDTQGIIKLEKPEAPKPEPAPTPATDEFRPIVEEVPEAISSEGEAPGAGESLGIIPIDLLAKANMSLFSDIETKGRMLAKFGNTGKSLYEMIDGQKDVVDISIMMHISFADLDVILAFLGKHGALLFRPLTRDEIKAKYGEDGFTIYKRYGRDGILLYELIGKEASLRDIIIDSKIDPAHAVEIFMFIHEVLGLEIPFDRDILYKQLGLA